MKQKLPPQAKQGRNSFPAPRIGCSALVALRRKANAVAPLIPVLLLPLKYTPSMMFLVCDAPLCCAPSQLLVPPARMRSWKVLACSATTKTSMCYQYYSRPKPKPQCCTGRKTNSIPAETRAGA